jgi:hypothetical protein
MYLSFTTELRVIFRTSTYESKIITRVIMSSFYNPDVPLLVAGLMRQ